MLARVLLVAVEFLDWIADLIGIAIGPMCDKAVQRHLAPSNSPINESSNETPR
jgi:hypothetical protein